MENKNINALLLTENNKTENISESFSEEFNAGKWQITNICRLLERPNFDEQKICETVKLIEEYVKHSINGARILYSEISSFIFSLDDSRRATFVSNSELLLNGVLKDESKEIGDDEKKIIIKIYDHAQLASHQIENSENIFNNNVETLHKGMDKSITETKEDFRNKLTDMQKDYIAILGIFASIVIAFSGGINFSIAALEDIYLVEDVHNVLAIILGVGIAFFDCLIALFNFVSLMVKDKTFINWKIWIGINGAVGVITALLIYFP